ncbi:MAG: SpoVG family protein [Planctomycetota bacterium]
MNITEAKVKLVSDKTDKLKAFCSITLDGEFVIRDIKVIEGTKGHFVAMPSRKLMDRCPSCGGKNHLRAPYCNDCGGSLRPDRVGHDEAGRAKLHADIAHPTNSACRDKIQKRVLEAYEKEVVASKVPGYRSAADDAMPEPAADEDPGVEAPLAAEPASPPPLPPPPPGEPDSFSGGIL